MSKEELDKSMKELQEKKNKNKIVKETVVSIDDLKTDGNNPNHMTKYQFEALKKKIMKEGFTTPVIVDQDLMIADGEHRWKAAKELGYNTIPVKKLRLTTGERLMLRQTYNKLHGTHDKGLDEEEYKLIYKAGLWEEFQNYLPDVGEYEKLLQRSLAKNKDPDAFNVEKAAKKPKYTLNQGDVYTLGKHRLMCGDSTTKDVLTLMNEFKAQCVFTDPPYGVSYTGASKPDAKEWAMVENDELRADQLKTFLFDSFTMMHQATISNPAIYCCFATINHIEFETALATAGFTVKQELIWDKGHVLGRSDYHWVHEPILYCRKDENCTWYGDRTHKTILNRNIQDFATMKKEELLEILQKIIENSDVVRIKRDNGADYVHPTQKPVDLPKIFIRNSSEIGGNVLDLFGWSGSTLIACEQTGRRCYTMELDPKYCSAIIERWEDFTGQKAKKEE